MKRFLTPLLLGLVLVFLSGCSRITSANFEKIKVGMSPAEVKAILGEPTSMQSQRALSLSSATYTYKKGDSQITVSFLNDKVIAKSGELK